MSARYDVLSLVVFISDNNNLKKVQKLVDIQKQKVFSTLKVFEKHNARGPA